MKEPFKVSQVVQVASQHPFYSSQHSLPLTPKQVDNIASAESSSNNIALLSQFQIKKKEELYDVVMKLFSDESPQNTFRHSVYISITGGGGGVTSPMAFCTDIEENRNQRAALGHLARRLGVITESDCVLSLHASGNLYRALDLTVDVVEYAGGAALPAGHLSLLSDLMKICDNFRPTILAGDTSQLMHFASHVEAVGLRESLKINKILYTSEPMTGNQLSYLETIFGRPERPLSVTSLFGSAEMGPCAVGSFGLTGPPAEESCDLIFDSRNLVVEVLPLNFQHDAKACPLPCTIIHDEVGQLVVTSLQRLRHPLVRYLNGDVGSVHLLPESVAARIEGHTQHLRILRLYGRNIQHSFTWEGEFFEFSKLQKLLSNPSWAILKWQVVLGFDKADPTAEYLELRLMRGNGGGVVNNMVSFDELTIELKNWFYVHAKIEWLFRTKLVKLEQFKRSTTGNKVIMFVDERKRV